FEMVEINQVEDEVAVIAAVAFDLGIVGAARLVRVRGNSGVEEAPVARAGERIGERGLLQLVVRAGQLGAALGDGGFEALALGLKPARPKARKAGHEQREGQKPCQYGPATAPPRRQNGEGIGGWRRGPPQIRRATGNLESVLTGRQGRVERLAQRSLREFGLEATQA